jgi:hypothetical protein
MQAWISSQASMFCFDVGDFVLSALLTDSLESHCAVFCQD